LCGAAVASGQPVIVQDVSNDPRYLTTFDSTGAEAIFPVWNQGSEIVGTLDARAIGSAPSPPQTGSSWKNAPSRFRRSGPTVEDFSFDCNFLQPVVMRAP